MEHEEIIPAYVDRLSRSDVDGLVDLFHDDCSLQMPLFEEPLRGKGPIREFYAELTSRWETVELAVLAAVAEGDIGMLEFSFDFTRPDGTRHADSSVDVFRYRDGSIASLRAYTDSYPLRKALGWTD